MRFALDLLYLLGLVLASPWLVYRSFRSGGWRDLPVRLGFFSPPGCTVWLHGSSVGEIRLIEPLVRLLEHEGLTLAISSHTVTGVRAAQQDYPAHFVFRLPLDLSFVQRRLLSRLGPRLIVIVESDLWPNQLLAAKSRGVPVAIVNAKLSDRSFRLHQLSRIVPRALRSVAVVAAQTAEHAARFSGLGVPSERVVVTGNMKYDQTGDQRDSALRSALRQRLGYGDDACVVIGGSLHPGEDEDLLGAFSRVHTHQQSARLIIVPRYPDSASAVIQNIRAAGFAAVAKSELDRNATRNVNADEIVVCDVLGELRKLYAAADIAFVGGSLYFRGSNKGGHNLMEPAILGMPVLFGPHNFSFRETVADLLAADAGVLVRDRDELAAALERLVGSRETRQRMGQRARQVVLEGQGASRRNLGLLLPLLDAAPGCSPTPQQAQCRHQTQTQALNE